MSKFLKLFIQRRGGGLFREQTNWGSSSSPAHFSSHFTLYGRNRKLQSPIVFGNDGLLFRFDDESKLSDWSAVADREIFSGDSTANIEIVMNQDHQGKQTKDGDSFLRFSGCVSRSVTERESSFVRDAHGDAVLIPAWRAWACCVQASAQANGRPGEASSGAGGQGAADKAKLHKSLLQTLVSP